MGEFLWICFGGAVGTGCRYLLSGWIADTLGPSFPFGTLAVNVIGSFLLAVILHVGLNSDAMSQTLRLTLSTGVMGGFTTYSTFSHETFKYIQSNAWFMAGLNMSVTFIVCLIGCWLGFLVGRWLVGT